MKDENDEKAKKTIEILNLKAIPLKEKRKKAWLLAREKFSNEEEYDLISAEAIRACWVQELNETYHLCVVHRAWFLKNYAQVLNA